MLVVRYRPEVADDLRDAADWYEQKRSGLGDEFLAEFWLAIDDVIDRPLSFAVRSTGLRACRIARFPYIIHFRFAEGDNEIVVFAVMFGGRDSSGWMNRV
jgi:plasmid stabilization system protein ParE